jgi:pimeloyl-ACP methyl ester carboxylesterase
MAAPELTDLPLESVDLPTGETITYRHRPGEVPLVLLHGNMTSSKHFDVVLEAIDERYDCYAMDMRGFGGSSYETPVDRLEDFADDAVAFVDAMGLDRFSLLGWSTGGGVAMVVAERVPERVEKLVLVAPVGTRGYPSYVKGEDGQPTDEPLTEREEFAADPALQPLVQAHETANRDVFRATWDALIYTHNSPEEAHYEAYIDDMLTQRNLVDVYYTLAHFNISEESNEYGEGTGLAADITAPTLVVRGDRDLVIPRTMVEDILTDVPDAELIELDDCGHSPPIDSLDELLETVESFLAD